MSQKQDKESVSIWKKFEPDISKWVITMLGILICTAIPFYYNTNNTISAHTTDITSLKTDMKGVKDQVSNIKADPSINIEQIKAIKELLEDVQARQLRLETRQDKMYDLILETLNKDKK